MIPQTCDIRDYFSGEDIEFVDKMIDVQKFINGLPEIEKTIVYLRAEGYTQKDIAEIVGLDRSRISQILTKIHKTA